MATNLQPPLLARTDQSLLIVFSHLRWDSVWQRPHHLVSRLGKEFDCTFFVEEPIADPGTTSPWWECARRDNVVRLRLSLPGDAEERGFDEEACDHYKVALQRAFAGIARPTVWLYTPMALELAESLRPSLLAYDVMDDLAAFQKAPPVLPLRQRQALRRADVVFTGGRSLHQSVSERRPDRTYCFPSGVEPEHYAIATEHRLARRGGRPVAGYVGVIDERLDLQLIRDLAADLPDWDLELVGPVAKIDPASLPSAPNMSYPGARPYGELPAVMGRFDVALMPFALNDATRSISPTKTLEYMAAGLPIVSTRVPDVVADYADVVSLHDDADGFAGACRAALMDAGEDRMTRFRRILHRQHWDTIAGRMSELLVSASAGNARQESA